MPELRTEIRMTDDEKRHFGILLRGVGAHNEAAQKATLISFIEALLDQAMEIGRKEAIHREVEQ